MSLPCPRTTSGTIRYELCHLRSHLSWRVRLLDNVPTSTGQPEICLAKISCMQLQARLHRFQGLS